MKATNAARKDEVVTSFIPTKPATIYQFPRRNPHLRTSIAMWLNHVDQEQDKKLQWEILDWLRNDRSDRRLAPGAVRIGCISEKRHNRWRLKMQKSVERESAAPPKPPKFKVGQIAVYDRAKKRSIPVIILEVVREFDTYFYRVDRKNAVAESMLREVNETELGERRTDASSPK